MSDSIKCLICGKTVKTINHMHMKKHGISVAEYASRFPGCELTAQSVSEKRSKALLGREITWKSKISAAVKESWESNRFQGRTGIPLSSESKKALSIKLMGHPVADDTRIKIGQIGLGRIPWNKGRGMELLEERIALQNNPSPSLGV